MNFTQNTRFFARYSRLPDWLAWDAFSIGNGCDSLAEMRQRIRAIRERIRYQGRRDDPEIGCIIIVQPTFFPPDRWILQPSDWPVRVQTAMGYDLETGEGRRVWDGCVAAAKEITRPASDSFT